MVVPNPFSEIGPARSQPPKDPKPFEDKDKPEAGIDPFSNQFDRKRASEKSGNIRDICLMLQRQFQEIRLMDAGRPGERSGRDNLFFTGFVWQDSANTLAISVLTAREIGKSKEAYGYASSIADGPINSILIGGQLIPLSRLRGVLTHHPSNMPIGNQNRLPLPTTFVPISGGGMSGDIKLLNELRNYGAPGDLILAVSAEEKPDLGYRLFFYSFDELPVFKSDDPSSWPSVLGRTFPHTGADYESSARPSSQEDLK